MRVKDGCLWLPAACAKESSDKGADAGRMREVRLRDDGRPQRTLCSSMLLDGSDTWHSSQVSKSIPVPCAAARLCVQSAAKGVAAIKARQRSKPLSLSAGSAFVLFTPLVHS